MVTIRMRDGSGEIRLKHLVEDMDRHGNVRIYFRRSGQRKIRIRSKPGTAEFLQEYHVAFADKGKIRLPVLHESRTPLPKNCIRWLCIQYFASSDFKRLELSTQTVRRRILDRICESDGDKPYALLEPRHIRLRRDAKADRPEAANGDIKALRQVFSFAVEYDLAKGNPAKDVPYLKSSSQGYHSWTPEEVTQFEDRFPVGTKARLALALFLYTGQRRSDIVRLGPQHVRGGWLTFTQMKNRSRNPVTLSIPVLPELQTVLDQTPTGNLSYIVTEFGKTFTSNGFGNWFRKRCDEAGLPKCSAHGLRKAGAAIAAENGATERQLMAIFGWSTMKEAARYTRAARQRILAEGGMKYLVADQNMNKSVPLLPSPEKSGTDSAPNPLKMHQP